MPLAMHRAWLRWQIQAVCCMWFCPMQQPRPSFLLAQALLLLCMGQRSIWGSNSRSLHRPRINPRQSTRRLPVISRSQCQR